MGVGQKEVAVGGHAPEQETFVDEAKVVGYLLSETHPLGRFKAAFFRLLGFSSDRWEELRREVLAHGQRGMCDVGELCEFGQKYEVRGTIIRPTGGSARLTAVWIVRANEDFPRFATAYPG